MGSRSNRFLLGFFAIFLFASILLSGCGNDEAKQLDSTKIAEYNKPGTVLVETVWTADVTIPNLTLDEDALINYILGEVAAGRLSPNATEDDFATAAIAELITNPQLYLLAGPASEDRVTTMESSVYGSGFIVREDGYIVTNAHIVKKSNDEIAATMAEQNAGDLLQQDLADFESALGISLPTDYEDRFLEAAANIYGTYYTVSDPTSETKMYTVSAGDKSISDGTVCEIDEVGDPIDMNEETGKDVAILKVNQNNLPTVALGDDSGLMDGVATFDYSLDLSKEISPTLTQGVVSAQKTMSGGWKIIQTDATISNGSSGSPLLNTKGEAIAVNTFTVGEVSDVTGEYQAQAGFNFAVPASVVKEFLDKANVSPELGPLTKTYREGIDLYMDSHYSAARDKFKEIQEVDSEFPYINDYIENSSAKINQGLDKSTFPIPIWLLIIIVFAVLLVIAVALVLLLVVIPRGKKKTPSPMPGPQAAPPTPQAPAPTAAAPTTEMPAAEPAAPEAAPPAEGTAPKPPEETTGTPAAGEEHNFCSKCGQHLTPGDEFCAKCGTHVTE
jgi:serine protease Do